MMPIIEVHNVYKKYRIGENQPYYTLRDAVTRYCKHLFRHRSSLEKNEFWALHNVSFNVNRGEALGVIGKNGAGKSTILKILSRVTPPTKGEATLRGRVASLLEVGTGFQLELTGRENIFLNGAILGMGRREVKARFDEIVAFSELEKFLDMPVKHYSSGMYVRLGFSIAAHLLSEILIVDEVLAVGDTEFQRKCLNKIRQIQKEGRTILFVSHNMETMKKICQRILVMDKGSVIWDGPAKTAFDIYTKHLQPNKGV